MLPTVPEHIADVYVPEGYEDPRAPYRAGPDGGFVYAGTPHPVPIQDLTPALRAYVEGLHRTVREEAPTARDFAVHYGNALWRGHRDPTLWGAMLALRRIPAQPPSLDDLHFGVPQWRELLLHRSLCRGGLITLIAVNGQGKSTTAAAIVVSRLRAFGGHARTIENPIELPLEGRHGDGLCVQSMVDIEEGKQGFASFAEGIRAAARAFPTGSPAILLVGEVRDHDTAAEVVRAALNGTLVITTLHAGSIITGLQRLVALADVRMGGIAADMVASALRVAIHQNLVIDPARTGWERGRIHGELLWSDGDAHAVSHLVRERRFPQLENAIRQQQIRLRKAQYEMTSGDVASWLTREN